MERRCIICMEWDKHIYWNILEVTKIQFWCPLRGSFTEKLILPKKFAKNFKENLAEVIHLRGPSGKTWHVRLQKKSDDIFFGNGWKEFVEAHLLEENDLLVFKFDGDSHFQVSVFDKSGCEKESAYFIKPCNHRNIYNMDDKDKNASGNSLTLLRSPSPEIHECSSTEQPHKDSQKGPSQHDHTRLLKRKSVAKQCQGGLKQKSLCVTSDSDSLGSDPRHDIRPYLKRKVKAEADSFCSLSSDESRGKASSSNAARSLKRKTTGKRDELAKSSYSSFLSSKRRPVTDEEIEKALERAMEFQPNNHCFLAVMKPTHVYRGFFMTVPKEFAAKHLCCRSVKLVLLTPHSKRNWIVSYRHQKCSSGFSGMWRNFVKHNNLEEGDVCVFELKENSKNITMVVHIFRVVEPEPVVSCSKQSPHLRR